MSPIGYLLRETVSAELDGLDEQDWIYFLDGRATPSMRRAADAVCAYDELTKEESRVPKKQSRRRKNRA